ncbi:cardiolipin synthase [Caldalkalibacillus uzonensis]|uniref:Cardiolipin synthase n=1 Tax=Caldalkalibacillus uzonensis TaxID=353224 RepID=A0ABU0CSF4_9BACI|nr:cardiolipin synthase [Caldalkalibacillus uzonensis]MDQ0339358.1 cardiolipin synthase [Caldalkalibacillus uzonensis]
MTLLIILVIVIGIIGLAALYVAGQHVYLRRQFQKKEQADGRLFQRVRHNLNERLSVKEAEQRFKLELHTEVLQFIKANTDFPLTQNDRLRILNNGEELFPALFEEIAKAKHHVHILFYTVQNDHISNKLFEKLEQKVQEGVQVRLLVDGVGSHSLIGGKRFKELQKRGIQCSVFTPPRLRFLPYMNFRNHRKIVVIDGNVAFTGGLNVGDEYVHRDPNTGFWRDVHLLIEGESVLLMQRIFATDWYYTTGELLEENEQFFPTFTTEETQQHDQGTILAQVVPSGPDMTRSMAKDSYLKVICAAKERVWLGTPYFVPDQEMIEALKQARKRGIEVKLIVPKRTDNPLAHYASFHFHKQLLPAGVEIYLYEKGFYHAKIALVDNYIANIGSVNLDRRSFYYSFEAGLFIYDRHICQRMETIFKQDLKDCKPLLPEQLYRQPLWAKAATQLSLIMAPWL